jgi:hypothetical protein
MREQDVGVIFDPVAKDINELQKERSGFVCH